MSGKIKFSPEINGLRAFSVLSVLIFHINPSVLTGGFLGVDVFFVISGYLITFIIKRDLDEKDFNFSDFYLKRIKRIAPLFFTVIFVTYIIAYLIFLPNDFRSLSMSAIASSLFLANFRFALMGDYFQADALKPLLHIWSLSVEEQFYFLWPIFLFCLWNRLTKKNLICLIIMMIVASFTFAEFLSRSGYSTFSYFILPTRAGELLIGALWAISGWKIRNYNTSNFVSAFTFSLLIISFALFNKTYVFPGFSSLIVCLLVIGVLQAQSGNLVSGLLSLGLLQYLGRISFSLYMWHWPIIVFYKYFYEIEVLSLSESVLLSILILAISVLSFNYIEDKARNFVTSSKKIYINYFAIPSVICICIAMYTYTSFGLPYRFDTKLNKTRIETVGCHSSLSKGNCYIYNDDKNDDKYLLIGDSHAGHYANFIKVIAPELGINVTDASSSGCAFFDDNKLGNSNCENTKNKIKSSIHNVDGVIISARFDYWIKRDGFSDKFIKFINRLASDNKKVIILEQVPKHINANFMKEYYYSKRFDFEYKSNNGIDPSYFKANSFVRDLLDEKGVFFVNLDPVFCSENTCLQSNNIGPFYFDDDHITAYGAEWAASKYIKTKAFKSLASFIKIQ